MLFNSSRAYDHVRALSFPRLSSTAGERKAGDYIITQLESFGLDPEIQFFSYSALPHAVILKISLLLQVALLLSAISLCGEKPFFAAVLAVLLLLYTLQSTRWGRVFETMYDVGSKKSSRNIYERITGSSPHTNLLFMAHYDSKSQTMPILFRVLCYLLFYIGMIVLILLLIGFVVTGVGDLYRDGLMHTGIVVTLFSIPAVFNFTKNTSPGALDNASGVGIVLELARILSGNIPDGLDVTFLFTGAEEEGLAGAIRFAQELGDTYSGRETFCLSYDGAGAQGKLRLTSRYGIPPVRTSRVLAGLVKEYCGDAGIDCSETYLPVGAGLEQTPLSLRGIDVITVHSGKLGKALLAVHSPNDVPDNLDADAVERSGSVGEALVQILAKRKHG